MKTTFLGLLVGGLALASASPALAAPVTVKLRIEGKTSTLYEGTVTTDVAPLQFTSGADQAPHTCDGTAPYGSASTPVPTRGAAISVAARTAPFAMEGSFSSYGASFTTIAGEDVSWDSGTSSYLAEYKNGTLASVGACGDPIQNGDDVLFAWGTGSESVLALSGPATAAPGQDVALTVTQEDTHAPVAGAQVGGQTSAADGTVHVSFADGGPHALKAAKAGAIRSNAATVCITDGHDGFCGTTAPGITTTTTTTPTPIPQPVPCTTTGDDGRCGSPDQRAAYGFITSTTEGKHYKKGAGPRQLSGRVDDEPSGIKDVELRLTRNDRGRCATYDGARERLVTMKRCGASRGRWFTVGTRADWTYLLPAKLPRGRYVLDVRVSDNAGNQDATLARGRNRMVFFVA